VELYIEIAHLWPKIKTWNLESATTDGLTTGITALLLEFAEADAFEKEATRKAIFIPVSDIPKPDWIGIDRAAFWARLDRQAEHQQELEWELLGV